MRMPYTAVLLALAAAMVALLAPDPARAQSAACPAPGGWHAPAEGKPLAHPGLIAAMAERPVVLLGESHTDMDHHRWQLDTLAALHGRRADMAIGFESFPRSVQPALDRWVAGELDEKDFLARTRWDEVWSFDPELYLPLFRFARMHRIPMFALNVDRALVARVGRDGWPSVPAADREGIGDPAPADAAYRARLEAVFNAHRSQRPESGSQAFDRFVEAQLTWDRAMAEALAARRAVGSPLVVGIVGAGHLQHRQGVPWQLADLGIPDAAVLLPWRAEDGCDDWAPKDGPAVADAIFMLDPAPEDETADAWKPLLGVLIETADDGVLVSRVVDDSVADEAGIRSGDVVVRAAGVDVAEADSLVAVIRRQAPGTWLPLTVLRDGDRLEVVAKFPTAP